MKADDVPGQVRYREVGAGKWVLFIGPVLVAIVLITESLGGGAIHWPAMLILGGIVTGFAAVQRIAANAHVSVTLTSTHLQQGQRVLPLVEIAKIYSPNHSDIPVSWESAPALGELSGVPRKRTGIGLKLTDGTTVQAWARRSEIFRTELVDAWTEATIGEH